MQRNRHYTALVILVLVFFCGCYETPTYSFKPLIEFDDIFFKRGETTDTLFVSIDFKDGDGDLGLSPNYDIGPPYHSVVYFFKENGDTLEYADRKTPPYDKIPPYEFPYSCRNYSIEGIDTFYIEKNPNHYNIFINFFIKKNGKFILYDWELANPPQCSESYNGRFPLLNIDNKETPLEGNLRYGLTGAGFEVIFKRDTVKLEIYIKDRLLNKSNVVESNEFIINDIVID